MVALPLKRGSFDSTITCYKYIIPFPVVNGSKMWISAGNVCDIVVCACITNPTKKYKGISMLIIEKGTFSWVVQTVSSMCA